MDNPINDLKSVAEKYIEYMKVIQPKGPYFIGGWSLGGGIAYEMAQQLKAEGESVLSVYLLIICFLISFDLMDIKPFNIF